MAVTITDTPPLLIQDDAGAWWIEIMLDGGQDVVQANVGDGAWLYQQIVEKLVLPRLRRRLTADENAALHGYASPND
jgi:hypothetical protein